MNEELALTRDWYERAAWLSEAGCDGAELNECIADLRVRVHRLERLADNMAATLQEQREPIKQYKEVGS
jgi:hypothetical protein